MGKVSLWFINPDTDCLYCTNEDGKFILFIKEGKLVRKSVEALPVHAEPAGTNWSEEEAIEYIRSNME